MSPELLNQIILIFILAAVGYLSRKKDIITGSVQFGLSSIVLNVALPCSILASANKPYLPESIAQIGIVLLGAVLYFVLTILAMTGLTKAMRLPHEQGAVTTLLVAFSNSAFIGYPVISIFLPDTGIFYASFFNIIFNVMFFTYGIASLSGKGKITAAGVFGNINNIASVVMILLYLLQFKMPTAIQNALEMLGGMATPLSMLVVGSMLGTIRLRQLFTTPLLYLVSFLRLLALPTLVFLVLRLLGIGGAAGTVLLIISGLPSASMTVMAAEKTGTQPEYASKGVLLSTLLFLATVPYLAFLQGLLPA